MHQLDLINKGETAFDRGEFDLAISFYRQAVALNPEDYELVIRLGSLLYHQFEFLSAEILYNQAITQINVQNKLGVPVGNLHLALGEVYLKLERLEEAEKQFTAASQFNADKAMLHTSLGNLHFAKGHYAKALVEYDEQINLDPTSLDGFLGKVRVFQQQKEYEKAANILSSVQILVPRNYNVEMALGNLASDVEDYSKALSHYMNAYQLAPLNPSVKYSIARIYLELEEFTKARVFFIDVLQKNPNDANAMYGLAMAEKSLGHNQEAITYLESAIIAQPFNASYYQLLFYAQLSSRKWLAAIRTALRARKLLK